MEIYDQNCFSMSFYVFKIGEKGNIIFSNSSTFPKSKPVLVGTISVIK